MYMYMNTYIYIYIHIYIVINDPWQPNPPASTAWDDCHASKDETSSLRQTIPSASPPRPTWRLPPTSKPIFQSYQIAPIWAPKAWTMPILDVTKPTVSRPQVYFTFAGSDENHPPSLKRNQDGSAALNPIALAFQVDAVALAQLRSTRWTMGHTQ